MNDRLKFRVWSEEEKRYITEELVYIIQSGDVLDSHNDVVENVVIEQCTGLKDKNGKLVFDGDIVKTKHDDVGVVIYSDHFLEWRIVFKKGRRHLLDNEEFGVPMFDFTENAIGKKILEVIGNIHNPELLK